MASKWRDCVFLLFATAAFPAGQAFGTDSMVMKASVRLTSLQMCAPNGSTGEKAKKTALSNGVALFSALCIGSSAGPSASRARDLSDGAFPTVSGDKGINLGYVLHPDIQTDIQKNEEPHRKAIIAVGAGAAGFGSVFFLRKKKKLSPQEWIDQKQADWKSVIVELPAAAAVAKEAAIAGRSYADAVAKDATVAGRSYADAWAVMGTRLVVNSGDFKVGAADVLGQLPNDSIGVGKDYARLLDELRDKSTRTLVKRILPDP